MPSFYSALHRIVSRRLARARAALLFVGAATEGTYSTRTDEPLGQPRLVAAAASAHRSTAAALLQASRTARTQQSCAHNLELGAVDKYPFASELPGLDSLLSLFNPGLSIPSPFNPSDIRLGHGPRLAERLTARQRTTMDEFTGIVSQPLAEAARVLVAKGRARRFSSGAAMKPEGLATWFLENQTRKKDLWPGPQHTADCRHAGIAFNLLSLLCLSHVCLPRSRPYTSQFFSLSGHNPSTGKYATSTGDLCFVAFCVVLLTGLRAGAIDYLLEPLGRRWGISKSKVVTRFAEQAWLVIFCGVSGPVGFVRLALLCPIDGHVTVSSLTGHRRSGSTARRPTT